MIYIKHPEHGNKHVEPDEAEMLVADGWVIWPRSKEAKAGVIPVLPEANRPEKRAYNRKAK